MLSANLYITDLFKTFKKKLEIIGFWYIESSKFAFEILSKKALCRLKTSIEKLMTEKGGTCAWRMRYESSFELWSRIVIIVDQVSNYIWKWSDLFLPLFIFQKKSFLNDDGIIW